MSIPKEYVIPGTKVIVDNKGTGINAPLVLTKEPGGYFDGNCSPSIGEELLILSKPKKYWGINVVKVQYKEQELFVYYTMLRYSTSMPK